MRRRDAQLIRARREPRETILALAVCVMRTAAVDDVGARRRPSPGTPTAPSSPNTCAAHRCRRPARSTRRRSVDRCSPTNTRLTGSSIARACGVIGGIRRVDVVRGQRHVQTAADRTVVRDGRRRKRNRRSRRTCCCRRPSPVRRSVSASPASVVSVTQHGLPHQRDRHSHSASITSTNIGAPVLNTDVPCSSTVARHRQSARPTRPSASARSETVLTDLQRRCIEWRRLRSPRAPADAGASSRMTNAGVRTGAAARRRRGEHERLRHATGRPRRWRSPSR